MHFERSKLSWQAYLSLPIWFRLPTNPPAFLRSRRSSSALNSVLFFCFLRTATRALISESEIESDKSSALLAVVWSATTSTTRGSGISGGFTSIASTSRWGSDSAPSSKSLFCWDCDYAPSVDCPPWPPTGSTVKFLAGSLTGPLPSSAGSIATSVCVSDGRSVVSLTGVSVTSCCSGSREPWELTSCERVGSPRNVRYVASSFPFFAIVVGLS